MTTLPLYSQRGFNLIEVLIALVVLTLGLLGIAALQLTTIRNTQGSYYRSQATAIANDLVERIHAKRFFANCRPADCVNFNKLPGNYVFNPPSTPTACPSKPLDTAPLPKKDIYEVACGPNGARSLLTGGSLQSFCINSASSVEASCDSESDMRMQINVNWVERGAVQEGSSAVAMNAASLENQTLTLIIQP